MDRPEESSISLCTSISSSASKVAVYSPISANPGLLRQGIGSLSARSTNRNGNTAPVSSSFGVITVGDDIASGFTFALQISFPVGRPESSSAPTRSRTSGPLGVSADSAILRFLSDNLVDRCGVPTFTAAFARAPNPRTGPALG